MNDHPTPEQLREFLAGRLDDSQARPVSAHVEQCVSCEHALARLSEEPQAARWRELLQQPDPTRELDPAFQARLLHNPPPAVAATVDYESSGRKQLEPIFTAFPVRFAGRYEILDRLGQGSMGQVYLAHDTELDKKVALKISNFPDGSAGVEQFRREARAAAGLDHDGLCRVLDFGRDQDRCYFTMDYVPGQPLSALMAGKLAACGHDNRGDKLPACRAVHFVLQVARAMAIAHHHGVCHRDLKPGNILIGPGDQAVVVDFGLAQRSQDPLLSRGRIGTGPYMSPEQARGEEAGPASDIYNLGVTLFQLLTGDVPFPDTDWDKLRAQILHEDADFFRLPPALQPICRKAMAKDAADRYRSMAELARDLDRFLDGWSGMWKWLTAASLLGLLMAGLTLFLIIRIQDPPGKSIPEPAGPGTQGLAPLTVREVKAAHFANMDNVGDRPHGLLGRESFTPRVDDSVTIDARLSRPAYAFLLAFRTDGQELLCFPEKADQPPPLDDRPRYPSISHKVNFGFNEGPGLQVFAVAASTKPLPAYRQWKDSRGKSPWAQSQAPPGVVWFYDGAFVDAFSTKGHDRTERGKGQLVAGKAQLVEITDWLRQQPRIETAAAIGFVVVRRK